MDRAEKNDQYKIPITVENFSKCIATYGLGRVEPWLHEETMDVGGGVISIEDIDRIRDFPDARHVAVSGLHQDTFEYFIRTYGRQFTSIFFFKNKAVYDWSLLGTLPDLEFIHWFFNQRIDRFWDMSENRALKGISIEDFSRLKDISGVEKAPDLRYFDIGNAVWGKARIMSFSPLKNARLEQLYFSGDTIIDKDLSFLKEMPTLKKLGLCMGLLTVEQFAWIRANCPSLDEESIVPDRIWECDGEKYVSVYGRGKKGFRLRGNEKRLKKVEDTFWKLVDELKGAPYPITEE